MKPIHYIENFLTLLACVAMVLGLAYLGLGLWSLTGLVILGNLNYMKRVEITRPPK